MKTMSQRTRDDVAWFRDTERQIRTDAAQLDAADRCRQYADAIEKYGWFAPECCAPRVGNESAT